MSRTVTFGGGEVHLLGNEVKVGDKAPVFNAVNPDLSPFNSEDNLGKVVIYSVVPSIDTGVCSIQTKTFNEKAVELGEDVVIVTVSEDLPFAQGRFCATEGIERALIVSDYQNREFGEKYGFLIDELKLLARGIVVVDREGVVQYVEYVPEVTNEVNFEKALEEAKKLV